MALWWKRQQAEQAPAARDRPAVCAEGSDVTSTYDNGRITFTGSLKGYDYEAILKDKQKHIYDIYKLADYFVDRDPIFQGMVKNVYTPFSVSDWR